MFSSLFKVVALVVFLSSVCFATADGPDNWRVKGVASNDTLSIRLQPNYKSKKVGKIPYNATCLKNLDCIVNKSRWCKIEYKGTIGWVSGRFLSEPGDCPSQKLPPIPVSVNMKKSNMQLEKKAMWCKNPTITKLDRDYTDIIATCSYYNQWINRTMTVERDRTYIVDMMMKTPYFIVNGFLGTSVDGVEFYNIQEIKSADIMDDGEMLCKFQAATDDLPPITDCFDSSTQKWIDVRDKNIQGNFTTLRNSGEASIVIKNNRVVDFVEHVDPNGY